MKCELTFILKYANHRKYNVFVRECGTYPFHSFSALRAAGWRAAHLQLLSEITNSFPRKNIIRFPLCIVF